jgi:hypothetical protein
MGMLLLSGKTIGPVCLFVYINGRKLRRAHPMNAVLRGLRFIYGTGGFSVRQGLSYDDPGLNATETVQEILKIADDVCFLVKTGN